MGLSRAHRSGVFGRVLKIRRKRCRPVVVRGSDGALEPGASVMSVGRGVVVLFWWRAC